MNSRMSHFQIEYQPTEQIFKYSGPDNYLT